MGTVGNALSSHRGYLSERANDLTRAMGKDKKDVGSKQVRIRDLNIPARELAQFSVNLDRRPNVGFPVAFYGADADPSLLHSQVTKAKDAGEQDKRERSPGADAS